MIKYLILLMVLTACGSSPPESTTFTSSSKKSASEDATQKNTASKDEEKSETIPEATPAPTIEPGSRMQIITLNAFNQRSNSSWTPKLKDIVNHEAPNDSNNYDSLITLAHETTHGINAYIRNKLNNTGKRANGFYLFENRAVLVVEPNIRKSKVNSYIPQILRGDRYDTYLDGADDWDDTPTYIMDEWTAYINGAEVGVQLVQQGKFNSGWQDAVMGPLEFTIYAIALGTAVKELDPSYFDREIQFKEVLAFNINRAMETYFLGSVMQQFKWDRQDTYLKNFQQSADAQNLRNFVIGTYGQAWFKRVFHMN